jgi:hypothetical protein
MTLHSICSWKDSMNIAGNNENILSHVSSVYDTGCLKLLNIKFNFKFCSYALHVSALVTTNKNVLHRKSGIILPSFASKKLCTEFVFELSTIFHFHYCEFLKSCAKFRTWCVSKKHWFPAESFPSQNENWLEYTRNRWVEQFLWVACHFSCPYVNRNNLKTFIIIKCIYNHIQYFISISSK